MKNLKFLILFALVLFVFAGKVNRPQEFIHKKNFQSSFVEKQIDQPEELYLAKQEIQTLVVQTNNDYPSFTQHHTSYYTTQNIPSICFLRLPILSSKHHPPTA